MQQSSGSLYRLTINNPEDPQPLTFAVGLIRLGGYLFLDAMPDDPVIRRYLPQVGAFHIFARVWVEQDAFLIRSLDGDWFKRVALAGDVNLAYVRLEENFFFLTAPTRDLQRFALQHATNGDAFPRASGITFVRTEAP